MNVNPKRINLRAVVGHRGINDSVVHQAAKPFHTQCHENVKANPFEFFRHTYNQIQSSNVEEIYSILHNKLKNDITHDGIYDYLAAIISIGSQAHNLADRECKPNCVN